MATTTTKYLVTVETEMGRVEPMEFGTEGEAVRKALEIDQAPAEGEETWTVRVHRQTWVGTWLDIVNEKPGTGFHQEEVNTYAAAEAMAFTGEW